MIIEKISGFIVTGETGSVSISETLILSECPDLIFIDVHLKERNCFDLVTQFRSLIPSSKIILMSMFAEEGYLNDSIAAGANAFLFKPSIPENLEYVLAALFNDPSDNFQYSSI